MKFGDTTFPTIAVLILNKWIYRPYDMAGVVNDFYSS